MFDAIIFEKLGIPAVSIITAPFRPTAQAICELNGMAEHRYAVIDHPITSLERAELLERARAAARQVEAALLGLPLPD